MELVELAGYAVLEEEPEKQWLVGSGQWSEMQWSVNSGQWSEKQWFVGSG